MIDDVRQWVEEHAGILKAAAVAVLLAVFFWWWLVDPPVKVGPNPTSESRVLILLHGHGASKTDLEPLAKELAQAAPNVHFIMPSAPHRTGSGYTWYPSFREDSQEAVNVRMLELRAEARAVVMEIVEDLRADGIAVEQIYIGGFSQGATVALDVVTKGPIGLTLGGLVSLSGGALPLPLAPLAERAVLHAFVSHGKSDPVLKPSASRDLVKALEEGEHDVQFVEFAGGHTVAPEAVQALGVFLTTP